MQNFTSKNLKNFTDQSKIKIKIAKKEKDY